MRDNRVRLCAVGDSLIVDRIARGRPEFLELQRRIAESDAAITNVETTLHDCGPDVYPSQTSGGDWVSANPGVLEDLKWLGFNLFSAPNNHSMDWLHTGVVRTIEAFEKAGAVYAGLGRNLADAEEPRYLTTANGRVAIVAVNLSFENWQVAGEQRRDCVGRPGFNYLSHEKTFGVEPDVYEALRKLARAYPSQAEQGPDGALKLGGMRFVAGERGVRTEADPGDVERLRRSISRARRQADIVLVSVHSHENKDGDPDRPADFEETLAHLCIDAGASAYVGHGPHVVRGIEIYNGRPILYSLGNFFYQCELVEKSPSEFYRKFAPFGGDACTADVFDYRVKNGGILGETNPAYFRSVLVEFSFSPDDALAGLTAHPLRLNFGAHRSKKGTPELAAGNAAAEILEDLISKSKPYRTELVREGDRAVLRL